jgi:hypothetical protein
VTALSLEARAADQASVDDFEVVYVTEEGAERTLPLTAAWAVAFECGCPVRRFRSRKGQRHLSGLWWSAKTGGHVDFESWLERDHVMALDFDAAVVGIASQPFWLRWADERPAARLSTIAVERPTPSSTMTVAGVVWSRGGSRTRSG